MVERERHIDIDSALAAFVGLTQTELNALSHEELTLAEQAALSIIAEAMESGGPAMKLLVERTGGSAVNRSVSVSASASQPNLAARVAAMLGGTRRDAVQAAIDAAPAEDDEDEADDDGEAAEAAEDDADDDRTDDNAASETADAAPTPEQEQAA